MLGIQQSLWPVHLKPIDGEILSSWVSRIAAGHGLPLNEFLTLSLPRPRGVRFDLDTTSDWRFLGGIAEGAGIHLRDAIKTSFLADQGSIYPVANPQHFEWVVPLILKGERSKHTGLPFCPSCLATDGIPYYRKRWRYGFFPVCPEHGVLITCCPNCGHPYAYQGESCRGRTTLGPGEVGACRGCGQHFSVVDQENSEVTAVVKNIQKRILVAMDERWTNIPGLAQLHVYPYLKGLRQLAMIFQRPDGCRIAAWIETQTPLTLPWESATLSNSFEKHPPRLRASALFLADWLMQEWPNRMIRMMKSLNLSSTKLLPPPESRPYWLSDHRIDDVAKSASRPSTAEIESAQRTLNARLRWRASPAEVLKFMKSLQLPMIRPLRPLAAPATKRAFTSAHDELAASYEWKKKLVRPHEKQVRQLYAVDSYSTKKRINEDIAEASEDIGGLWVALRTRASDKPDG